MRLTRAEDGHLRRLHFFQQRGAVLAAPLHEQLLVLRTRDGRRQVREPWESEVLRAPSAEHHRVAGAR